MENFFVSMGKQKQKQKQLKQKTSRGNRKLKNNKIVNPNLN